MAGASTTHLHHSDHHHQQLADIEPRPPIFRSWERARQRRAHWLVECIAEMVSLLDGTYLFFVGTHPVRPDRI